MLGFDISTIDVVVFDLDGTFYPRDKEHNPGKGTIELSHDFFRYSAFQKLSSNHRPHDEVSKEIISEYQKNVAENTLQAAVEAFPEALKQKYSELLEQYGANGKIFVGEFGADSSFLQEMLTCMDFRSILKKDRRLQETISYLKQRGYKLGMFTTDIFQTAVNVTKVLGINLDDFYMDSGDEFPILCGENVQDKKPSHEGFKKIIQIYQGKPGRIAYIGDYFGKDVRPSLELGLQAIHVLNSGTDDVSLNTVSINGSTKQYVNLGSVYALTKLL